MKSLFRHVVGQGDENSILVAANGDHVILRQLTDTIILSPKEADELSEAIMRAGAASIRSRRTPAGLEP